MSDVDNNVIALMVLQQENKQLKNKLEKIDQIINGSDDFIKRNADYKIAEIKEVLEKE